MVEFGEPVPKGGGSYRLGRPYMVAGRTYVPREARDYREEGLASWYGDKFHGRRTANGEVFDMDSLSAAHPTLPIPSYVRVTNLDNRRSVVVRVNDRGPYHGDRVIDVSIGAARALGFHHRGTARVRVEYVGRAALDGSDEHVLMATLRDGEPAPPPASIRLASARAPAWRGSGDRGDVPVPPDRPFTLGTADAPAAPPASEVTAARPPPAVQVASSLQPRSLVEQARALKPRLASAYAADDEGLAAQARPIVSGRGLY